MIQMQSRLTVADNSGAKSVRCIKVLGGSKRWSASLGDVIVVSVQDALPRSKVSKGDVRRAVIVRTIFSKGRRDATFTRFDDNAVVLLDAQNAPLGTRIFGPVMREIKDLGFSKIASLAPGII